MAYNTILVETKNRVALVTLDRPDALNALNDELLAELLSALLEFEADDQIGCIVVTGAEKAFAAGGSSLRDYARADGELGLFQHAFQVYGRDGAGCLRPGCKGAVKRIIQNNRSTFFCPACQR